MLHLDVASAYWITTYSEDTDAPSSTFCGALSARRKMTYDALRAMRIIFINHIWICSAANFVTVNYGTPWKPRYT